MNYDKLRAWVGSDNAILAIVFTDLVNSSILIGLGNEKMREIMNLHRKQGRRLIKKYEGCGIKTDGDSFLAVFRTALDALDFMLELYCYPGHEILSVREGMNVGLIHVTGGDIENRAVYFAHRVSSQSKKAGIWLSNSAKEQIDQENAKKHSHLIWMEHRDRQLKGFKNADEAKEPLWSIVFPDDKKTYSRNFHPAWETLEILNKDTLKIIRYIYVNGPVDFEKLSEDTLMKPDQLKGNLVDLINGNMIMALDKAFNLTKFGSLFMEGIFQKKDEFDENGNVAI